MEMALQLPPVVKTSKKKVPGTRVFDSSRVFADYDPKFSNESADYRTHYSTTYEPSVLKTSRTQHPKAGLVNKPNPTSVHFLFDNPRFINEPVCHASSKATKIEQHKWWPTEVTKDVKPKPSYSLKSTNRCDFSNIKDRPTGLTRFGCSENKKSKAVGIVPVSQIQNKSIKTEKISYEHMCDSRKQRTERGRLQGAFVWDTTNDTKMQSNRRYAKRYFTVNETIDMRDCSSDLKHVDNVKEVNKYVSVPTDEVSPLATEKHKSTQSTPESRFHQKSLVKREDRKHNSEEFFGSSQQNKTFKSNSPKSELKPMRVSPTSPPPHVF